MLNPPTVLQEDTIHNIIRRMSLLCPWTQEVLPRWHLSVVLEGLRKPPFAINGSDRNISLELLSYKTAFLVALATGVRGSELVALSHTPHNLDFKTLDSGARQVSIRMVPKFIPNHQCPEPILKPLEFPGIAHLFPKDIERLLCPVGALGLYLIRYAEGAKDDSQQKLFVHFSLEIQLFTTHFRRWVAETLRLTYENSSESDLPKVRAHDVRVVTASIAYYRNTPLSELSDLIGWKSPNVFVRHYLKDMAADTELQDLPLVAPHMTLHLDSVLLLIVHHLHQCKLTLVVYQWPVGTFYSIMVDFLIGYYTYRMFPPAIPPPPSGELLKFLLFHGWPLETGKLTRDWRVCHVMNLQFWSMYFPLE